MPRSAKEQVDITALIRGILNGYPGNSAIFREYLQNSDDAKATKQIFILDERVYPSQTVCDPILNEAQGPALLAVNDGLLTLSDWESLRKIHSSSKKSDETQTGKNGLGFRASYHLTENPHVLSGDTLMILDPHHRFAGELAGGLDISVTKEGVDFIDQLQPLKAVVADPLQEFEGTAFRLPLRTASQARQSKIKEEPTSVSEIRDLLHNFGTNELEDAILFLKHITTIEIRHISPDGRDQMVGKVSITPRPTSANQGSFTRTTTLDKDGVESSRSWNFQEFALEKEQAISLMSERLGYDVGDALAADKLVPSIELATTLEGAPIRGSLYTLLPLPIRTGFPVHINAVFALTPDRQSLKNMDEVGTAESRERRLVEWNNAILNTWTPDAWARLLEKTSANSPGSAWSVWPPDSRLPYWNYLLRHLIEQLIARKVDVFPVVGATATCINLNNPNVLLAPQDSPLDLSPLLELGLKIVQPPSHILSILQTSNICAQVLSPQTLHGVLVDGYEKQQWQDVEAQYLRPVIDYLVFSSSHPCLNYIAHLPWFTASDGSPTAIQPAGFNQVFIVPASQHEAELFMGSNVLAWDSMDEQLRTTLLRSAGSVLGARGIQTSDVISVLSRRFSAATQGSSDYDWIFDFWKWLEGSKVTLRKTILTHSQMKVLNVLPSSSNKLRKISEKIAQFDSHDSSSASWRRLGVPILHNDISATIISLLLGHGFLETPQTTGFIPFVLNHVDIEVSLRPDEVTAIRRSLHASIVRQRPKLSRSNKENFAQLPIFATRPHGGGQSLWASVSGPRVQVLLDDGFPLPIQRPPTVYIDVRDRETECFIELLEGHNLKTDLEILRIAMDNWAHQPPNSIKLFVEQILNRSRHLSRSDKARLRDLPFVTVNGTKVLQPPRGLIDPRSELAPLYDGETGKTPVGSFAKEYLPDLQNLGFLSSTLNVDIVEERLTYFSDTADSNYFQKATTFIKLLDQRWDSSFATTLSKYHSVSWLPLSASQRTSPLKSRDQYTSMQVSPYLYDLVLRILDTIYISNSSFRVSLGWSDAVPVDLVIEQLQAAVALPSSSDQYERLRTLLVYLGQRHSKSALSSLQVLTLQEAIEGRHWIPIVGSASETVSTEYALLEEINLKHPFRQARQDIPRSLLQALGCSERPNLKSLLGVLGQYNTLKSWNVQTVVAILEEIAEHHPSVSLSSITIPTEGLQNQPLDLVYYPDIGGCILPSELADRLPVHSSLSRSLCEKLQIPSLTALLLELNDEAFDEDEQMGEDLGTRIHGFLKEYDITYAFNEFLANADDARAGEVRVTLDCRRILNKYSVSGFISPNFVDVLSRPTLYLFNDGKMNEQDFKGLRRVGQGGKTDQTETHGRHGLGALAFYYFTDIVTVISGEHVMILDPSGKYLPPNRGQKRTSLSRHIRDFLRQYPQQLKRYLPHDLQLDGSEPFNGTLFCLPLNQNLSGSSCDVSRVQMLLEKSYRELSQNAFFFTSLAKITAQIHHEFDAEEVQNVWTFSAEREHQNSTSSSKLRYHHIKLFLESEQQDWLVLASRGIDIPEVHSTTATGLKLTSSGFSVQIAVQTSPRRSKPDFGWLFSTLRLPRRSSLPFHLNARFAISSNRQSIVLDSPDSQKMRDAKSAFNAWIFAEVVPALYLNALEHFVAIGTPRDLSSRRWWLLEPGVDDGISRVVSESFLKLLTLTDIPLFRTVNGCLISFKKAVFESKKEEDAHIASLLKILEAERLVLGYSTLSRFNQATLVDASYVAGIMKMTSLESVAELCQKKKLFVEDLIDILLYICQTHITPGLPLLMLSSNIVASIPGASAAPIYFSHIAGHAKLFISTPFLHIKFSSPSIPAIWTPEINVVPLTPEAIPDIIEQELENLTDTQTRDAFLKQFWDAYHGLPGPPEISTFKRPSLRILALTTGDYISLDSCNSERVVYLASNERAQKFGPALEGLGLHVLRHEKNSYLKSYLSANFPDPEVNVLQCLATKNITSFHALSEKLRKSLAEWLKDYIRLSVFQWRRLGDSAADINKNHLYRLQIWDAKSTRGAALRSVEQMQILPGLISAESISPFLRPNIAIAQESTHLAALKMFCLSRDTDANVCMSISDILNSIIIPNGVVNTSKIREYRHLFSNILSQFNHSILSSVVHRLQLVDLNGEFRQLTDLYDHSEPLFESCLSFTSRPQFMHPVLRDINLPLIRRLGLIHQVSLATFRTCVRALEAAIVRYPERDLDEDPEPSRDALRDLSRVAFECFTSRMPRIVMRNQSSWESLDTIQFVRVKDSRRQGASYPADLFCEFSINEFASPSECVLPKYEAIAWTQRALFFHEPTDDLTALHQTLGVPKTREVVAHLRVLTLRVARSHPGNLTLLSDLTATYKWLNDHADDARESLLLMEDQDIFLNVDDPITSPWPAGWVSAKKIVLNLSYDWGAFKHVRRFLEAFPNLLRAAGCRGRVETNLTTPSVPIATTSTSSSIMKNFNDMRIAGELTDIELVPMYVLKDQARIGLDEDDVDVEMEVDPSPSGDYQAHRAYLAATVPHLRSLANFRQDTKFKFFGSKFGARAVLDFIYTGDFSYEPPAIKPGDPVEPVEDLLYELLELLSIANEWQYPDLTSQIEKHILHKYNLVNFLFFHHAAMLQKAREYNAKNLEKALLKWAEENYELLQGLPKS
ncbi:hypothetical protein CPB83DRAFT_911009 [Crepidotus variabilis]|uniref:BTB domain-containing protein n=1 Tax=Crepidotus variabilis TaxID=179855 RepID=A0A9P6E5I5_9AGAR|nr:hypothetical protein CPB83DRAFT_911009 [Crepidotus variabilis]